MVEVRTKVVLLSESDRRDLSAEGLGLVAVIEIVPRVLRPVPRCSERVEYFCLCCKEKGSKYESNEDFVAHILC